MARTRFVFAERVFVGMDQAVYLNRDRVLNSHVRLYLSLTFQVLRTDNRGEYLEMYALAYCCYKELVGPTCEKRWVNFCPTILMDERSRKWLCMSE